MKKYFFDLPEFPDFLDSEAEEQWEKFFRSASQAGIDLNAVAAIHDEALRVWPFSDFIARSCAAVPEMLADLAESGDLHARVQADSFMAGLSSMLENVTDDHALGAVLRAFRRREMVRIAWRDLAGMADLAETVNDLSLLAAACLDHSCQLLYAWLCHEFGRPLDSAGSAQELVVIGMGKLGAGELNFSSDIDLIFAFPEEGETTGNNSGKKISCTQFFTRMCRRLIAVIGAPGPDGFVFRVDTRLRPWGDSGPIVMSFDAIENYYEAQGRDWERYAWIKAGPVAGDIDAGRELLARLTPFVYRRYLDYSAFDALRDMKSMIESETRRKGIADNVKLGAGGIREVEFIVQAFQLLQGGRDAELRNPVLLKILPVLADRGVIPARACAELEDAYVFLRNTEHRLQEYGDTQTQDIPTDQRMRDRLALSMGFSAWDLFEQRLETFMKAVHDRFHALFMHADQDGSDENGASQVWQAVRAGNPEKDAAYLLEVMGFSDPRAALSLLSGIEDTREVRSMLPQGRRRLDSLMPGIIKSASATHDPLQALRIISSILRIIARRTVYISLLHENPDVVDHLLKLCMASPWITNFITRRPVVLDELLDPRTLYTPPDREELKHMMQLRFHSVPDDDLEMQMDELRMFRQSVVMRIAAADITGAVPLMRVSDYLTEAAEVITEKVLELSCIQMAAKFMKVSPSPAECREKSGFLVVAYGKFGGIELGYGSDLDLVFVHDTGDPDPVFPQASTLFYAKTGQRMIHILGTRTSAGILYAADMRLRPGGESGPLVCSIERLEHYLKNEAWTWEHQAMIRARPVAGSPVPARRFREIRKEIIMMERDEKKLRREVCTMRDRMVRDTGKGAKDAMFDIKRNRGGMIDIEFMVQYLVLLHACRHPALCKWTDNMRLIDTLEENAILSNSQASVMRKTYLSYRKTVHMLGLQEKPARVLPEKFSSEVREINSLWETVMS